VEGDHLRRAVWSPAPGGVAGGRPGRRPIVASGHACALDPGRVGV